MNASKFIFIIFVLAFIFSPRSSKAFTLNSSDPQEQGWANKALTFNLNPSNCPANIGNILNAATGIWNSIPTSFLFINITGNSTTTATQLLNGTAQDSPVIICDANFGSDLSVDPNSIAGVGLIGTAVKPIAFGGLIVNAQAGAKASVGAIDATLASIVLAHEIGHVLGLGHSADNSALMYYNASAKTKLALAQDDVDGITYLYPRSELGGDSIFGCGLILPPSNVRPPGFLFSFILLLFPGLVVFLLRIKSHRITKMKKFSTIGGL